MHSAGCSSWPHLLPILKLDPFLREAVLSTACRSSGTILLCHIRYRLLVHKKGSLLCRSQGQFNSPIAFTYNEWALENDNEGGGTS